jgi:hypothetical protein
MKLIALTTLALVATATAAAPAQQSKVTGYQTLIAIGNVRGIQPALTVAKLQALKVNTAEYRTINTKLRLSSTVFSSLMAYGNKAVPTVLATQAVLEAASGESVFVSAVQALIAQNPDLAIVDANKLNEVLRDPATAAAANAAAEQAAKAVTPTKP